MLLTENFGLRRLFAAKQQLFVTGQVTANIPILKSLRVTAFRQWQLRMSGTANQKPDSQDIYGNIEDRNRLYRGKFQLPIQQLNLFISPLFLLACFIYLQYHVPSKFSKA